MTEDNIYKNSEIFKNGKLIGEIFSNEETGNRGCGFVGALKKNFIEIENNSKRYSETYNGIQFDEDKIKMINKFIKVWKKRRCNLAGWVARGAWFSGLTGYDHSKPGSNKWTYIKKKNEKDQIIDIKELKIDEVTDGFNIVREKYYNNELTKEIFYLHDGMTFILERKEFGIKNDKRGLIVRDHELPTFNELIKTWEVRRDLYESNHSGKV